MGAATAPTPMWEGTMTTKALLATLLLLVVGVTACAMSEETRCKNGGGVWRGTMCETPAR